MPPDLPTLCRRSLATLTRAAKSAGSHNVESDGDTRGRVLTVTAHPSSVAQRSFRRQTPEVGARCVNHARRDLCGGCAAMRIPTAISQNQGYYYGQCRKTRNKPCHVVSSKDVS